MEGMLGQGIGMNFFREFILFTLGNQYTFILFILGIGYLFLIGFDYQYDGVLWGIFIIRKCFVYVRLFFLFLVKNLDFKKELGFDNGDLKQIRMQISNGDYIYLV